MDEDITKLTDEELDKKLEETEEKVVDSPEDTQTSEETEDQAESEQALEEEQEGDTPKEEEPKPPSRREQLRIQDILAKRKKAEQLPSTLPTNRQDSLDYQKELDADPAVIKRLESDRQAEGDARFNQGLERAKTIQFHTRLEIDAPRVESKYKFLDKSSDEFDEVRAHTMNSLYLDYVGYDPGDPSKGIPETVNSSNIRYADFVEAQMEFAEALMATNRAQTVKNVAKQAAQTGLRPDGSSAKMNLNKAPEDMTDEELDAVLARGGLTTKRRQ